MYDPFVTCISCGSYLPTSPVSPTHARVGDEPDSTSSLAWCAGCNEVSHFQRPRWRRWLRRWAPLGGFEPVRALSLDEVAAQHVRTPKGFGTYRDLIEQISLSFAYRARAEGAADVEAVAWRHAKQVLPPSHLLGYIAAMNRYASGTRLLLWLDEVEELPQVLADTDLKKMVRNMRDSLLENG